MEDGIEKKGEVKMAEQKQYDDELTGVTYPCKQNQKGTSPCERGHIQVRGLVFGLSRWEKRSQKGNVYSFYVVTEVEEYARQEKERLAKREQRMAEEVAEGGKRPRGNGGEGRREEAYRPSTPEPTPFG